MIQLTASRESSSAIQSRASDSQTRLLTNSGVPSSLPTADDHTAVDRDDLFDEIDSLLNKFDLGGRPLSTDSQFTGRLHVVPAVPDWDLQVPGHTPHHTTPSRPWGANTS